MKRVTLQPAFVLHRRAYRESSFLVEVFTPDYGRLTVVARGARRAKSGLMGLLQPFSPLWLSFAGRGELMSLSQADTRGMRRPLMGECLFAGFYLNELLMILLQKWDAHPRLYHVYEQTLSGLQSDKLKPSVLRSFEKSLLEELGYGLFPKSDISLHNSFSPDQHYQFVPEQGFVRIEAGILPQKKKLDWFSGKSLLAIAKEDWQDEQTLQDAKRLARLLLAPLLGARPLYSRRLFIQPEEGLTHE